MHGSHTTSCYVTFPLSLSALWRCILIAWNVTFALRRTHSNNTQCILLAIELLYVIFPTWHSVGTFCVFVKYVSIQEGWGGGEWEGAEEIKLFVEQFFITFCALCNISIEEQQIGYYSVCDNVFIKINPKRSPHLFHCTTQNTEFLSKRCSALCLRVHFYP